MLNFWHTISDRHKLHLAAHLFVFAIKTIGGKL